jgi:hypothetical protein
MIVTVTQIIDRCALFSEGGQTRRITRPLWLQCYNNVQVDLATEIRCLECDATFDIVAEESRYAYRQDMVSMKRLWFSETPAEENTYRKVKEAFPDEWEDMVSGNYPGGYVHHYIARPSFFQLVARPEAAIVDGGMLTYWATPTWLELEDNALMEVPYFLSKHVQEGMQILARIAARERGAAAQDYERWKASLSNLREKIEDRSDDRRSALRPEGYDNPYRGHT